MRKFFISLFLIVLLFSCGKKEKTIEIDNENNLSDNVTEEAPVKNNHHHCCRRYNARKQFSF